MGKFIIVACINQKQAIGKNGKLLYHIRNDISNFAKMTSFNGVLIMGRKTFESLPNGEPLKDRVNIILTSNVEYGVTPADNVFVANSIEDTIDLCEALFPDKELFVIGGESIYQQFLDKGLVSEMRLTVVNDETEGDAHFPELKDEEWYEYYKSMAQVSTWEGVDTSFYFQVFKKTN